MTSQVTLYTPKDWLSGLTGRTSGRTMPTAEERGDTLSIDASIVKFADIKPFLQLLRGLASAVIPLA